MDVTIERDVPVPMRDQTVLRADVWRPAGGDPAPAVVQRTPYGKAETRNLGGMVIRLFDALDHGYAVVVQDVRGRHASAGSWLPFVHERDDGYDTVEWVAAQPWCNGEVATAGASYLGLTALAAAVAAPPSLHTTVAYLAGSDLHDGWVYSGGAFELGDKLKWSASLARDALARAELGAERRAEIAAGLDELNRHPAEATATLPVRAALPGAKECAPWWDDWLDHPARDDYWGTLDLAEGATHLRVPVLHIAGFHDAFLQGHLVLERALRTSGPAELRGEHRFVLGPWDHEAYLSVRPANAGVRNFGPAATSGPAGMSTLVLRWLGTWMHGGRPASPDPAGRDTAPVTYFLMGPDRWQPAPSWPPPDATPLAWYLRSGGHANSRHGDGRLDPEPPGEEPADTYRYDPARPVPTCGGRFNAYGVGPGGVQDQRGVEDRDDVLVYVSDPLPTGLTVAGNVSVRLWFATDAPDADVCAKLVDVEPDGPRWNVAEGILRCRYRHGSRSGEETWMTPGEATEVVVDLWDTAYRFEAGHRVGLEVASSNFPRFDRNPNSAVPVADTTEADLRVATQHVHHDRVRASVLVLPVLATPQANPPAPSDRASPGGQV